MTKEDKRLLLQQAARLTTLGIKVERERDLLRKMVERGTPFGAPKMLTALVRFKQADTEWKQLETEHLALRDKLGDNNR